MITLVIEYPNATQGIQQPVRIEVESEEQAAEAFTATVMALAPYIQSPFTFQSAMMEAFNRLQDEVTDSEPSEDHETE